MAAVSLGAVAVTATLGTGVADTVTISVGPSPALVEILNHDATGVIWARFDGTAAVVDAVANVPIPPNSSWVPPVGITTISLISSEDPKYTVSRIV